MVTRSRQLLLIAVAALLSVGLVVPAVASAKRYAIDTVMELKSDGTVYATETGTVYRDATTTQYQERFWTYPKESFPRIDIIGVFTPGGTPYQLKDSAGAPQTYSVEKGPDGIRVVAYDDGSILAPTHVLRYRQTRTVKRYYNAAAFNFWALGTYDSPVAFTARIVPPRQLAPFAVWTAAWPYRGGKWVSADITYTVDAAGSAICRGPDLPAGTAIWTRTNLPAAEFADTPLTVGNLWGITRSPAGAKLTYRRSGGAVSFTLGVTAWDCVGNPLKNTRIYLQKSKNGRSGWKSTYPLRTSSAGTASRTVSAKKPGTIYYRWYVPAKPSAYRAAATGRQAVVIK